jgi:hypothetical protein
MAEEEVKILAEGLRDECHWCIFFIGYYLWSVTAKMNLCPVSGRRQLSMPRGGYSVSDSLFVNDDDDEDDDNNKVAR